MSTKNFQNKVNEIFGEENWTVISFSGVTKTLKIKHKCGAVKEYSQARSFLKSLGRCESCSTKKIQGRPRLTFKELNDRINRVTHGTYELIDLTDSTSFIVNHKSCDRKPFSTSVSRFFSKGQRCQCSKKGVVGRKPSDSF